MKASLVKTSFYLQIQFGTIQWAKSIDLFFVQDIEFKNPEFD